MTDYRQLFVQSLHQADPHAPELPEALQKHLAPRNAQRWEVYARAYFSRICETLASTLFENASILYGQDYIQQLILQYLQKNAPEVQLLPDLLKPLCDYWDTLNLRPDIQDMLRLCQLRWQVLSGDDPQDEAVEGAMEQLYLQKNNAILVSSAPLYDLWQASALQLAGDTQARHIADEAQTVLLFKSSPLHLSLLKIPHTLLPFVQAMHEGQNLVDALDTLPESTSPEELQNLIHSLQAAQAFVRI